MESNQSNNPQRDQQMWEIAQRRVSFKNHLAVYIVVNLFLWATWYFYSDSEAGYWPIYSTLGWGVGVLFHYLGAYVFPKENSVEREYEKMMRNKK